MKSKHVPKKGPKKGPKDPLRIRLDASELILFDNGETRLSGTVEFIKQEGSLIPKEIELRFVAGAVSKFEDSYQEIFLRGTDRFFDKKILLWNDSSHLTSDLPNAQDLLNGASFPFGLQIPNTNPPSVKNDTVIIEYVLAAVVYYQDSCCFGWVPAFSPDPFVTKEVLNVRKVRGSESQYAGLKNAILNNDVTIQYHPILDNDPVDLDMIPVNLSSTDLSGVFGHVSCSWIPVDGIKITLPGCISSSSSLIPIKIDSTIDIVNLNVSLIQEENLIFKYNVDPSRPYGQDSLKTLKIKDKKEVLTLYSSNFENISNGLNWIPHSDPLTSVWELFLEDLITKPAIIKHEFRISLKTKSREYKSSTPVIVYNMPIFSDDETIIDTNSETNYIDIARAAEDDFDLRRRSTSTLNI